MINPDSELFRNHKDFIVGDINNYELALSRHQLVLDFSNPNHLSYINDCELAFMSLVFSYYNIHNIENKYKLLNW